MVVSIIHLIIILVIFVILTHCGESLLLRNLTLLYILPSAFVRQSYRDPLLTWSTNVQGSLHLLDFPLYSVTDVLWLWLPLIRCTTIRSGNLVIGKSTLLVDMIPTALRQLLKLGFPCSSFWVRGHHKSLFEHSHR